MTSRRRRTHVTPGTGVACSAAAPNPRNLRFCVTCGHPLGPERARPALPPLQKKASSRPPPPPGRGRGTIRPPSFDAPRGATRRRRPSRHRGSSTWARLQRRCSAPLTVPRGLGPDPQFCRFCGASLADGSLGRSGASGAVSPAAAARLLPGTAYPRSFHRLDGCHPPAPDAARLVPGHRARRCEGPRYLLGDMADIGRTEGSIIVAEDQHVSPRHAAHLGPGGFFADLGVPRTYLLFASCLPEPPVAIRLQSANVDKILFGSTRSMWIQTVLTGQQVLKFEVVRHAEEGSCGVRKKIWCLERSVALRYARLSQRTVEVGHPGCSTQ